MFLPFRSPLILYRQGRTPDFLKSRPSTQTAFTAASQLRQEIDLHRTHIGSRFLRRDRWNADQEDYFIAMEHEEAVILVVGGEKESESKALVADALAKGRRASCVETTKAGARIFSRKSSPAAVVVETTAFVFYNNQWCLDDCASRWISLNSLRQMYNKLIYVVCVVFSIGPEDPVHRRHELLDSNSTWLDVLAVVFEKHQLEIMVLAKVVGTDDTQIKRSGIVEVLSRGGFAKNNISFVTFTREDLYPTIKLSLEISSFYPVNNAGSKQGKEKTVSIAPFRIKKVTSGSKGADWHGPWGPTPVILFGRTGSGKSTLAQMLTQGSLDPRSTQFAASSSIRGETTKVSAGEGRGWYVVDTPGFGEPDDSDSTVSTEEAEKRLKRYVKWIQGRYCHFLYVVMKDRMDQLEVNLWKFFVLLFGDDIADNFTVVISNAGQSWVEKNKSHLQSVYEGCKSFVSAEFPPIKTDDKEWEEELEEVRTEALCHVEEELVSSFRCSSACDFGLWSEKNIEAGLVSMNLDILRSGNSLGHKALAFGATSVVKGFVGVKRLLMMLKSEEKLLLLPIDL